MPNVFLKAATAERWHPHAVLLFPCEMELHVYHAYYSDGSKINAIAVIICSSVFQVRISVMTTLTPTTLQIDEGWYDVEDGTKIIELEGPILLHKVSSYAEDR